MTLDYRQGVRLLAYGEWLFHDPKVDHGYLSKSLWILYYQGEMFEIILENELYNKTIDHVSYDKVWLLLDVKPITYNALVILEIFALLKDLWIGWCMERGLFVKLQSDTIR